MARYHDICPLSYSRLPIPAESKAPVVKEESTRSYACEPLTPHDSATPSPLTQRNDMDLPGCNLQDVAMAETRAAESAANRGTVRAGSPVENFQVEQKDSSVSPLRMRRPVPRS